MSDRRERAHFDAVSSIKLAVTWHIRRPVSKRVNRSGEGDDDPVILEPIDMTVVSHS
jgi:hypothetical protein